MLLNYAPLVKDKYRIPDDKSKNPLIGTVLKIFGASQPSSQKHEEDKQSNASSDTLNNSTDSDSGAKDSTFFD